MSKLSRSVFKKYMEGKQKNKQDIKISSTLFNTILTLAIKKSSNNHIYYIKDKDTFCIKSELPQLAENAEEAIRNGEDYDIPTTPLLDLSDLNVLYMMESLLSTEEKKDAEQDYKETAKRLEELESFKESKEQE